MAPQPKDPKAMIIARSESVLVAQFAANSRPDPYVGTWTEHATVCTCPGWHFRRTCKHADALRLLANELGMNP